MVKYIDMVEGKEYRYGSASMPYKKEKGILYYPAPPVSNKWLVSGYTMREIAEMVFEEIPWVPEYDECYYYPVFTDPGGIRGSVYRNDDFDKMVIRAVGCYKTKEEARAKARELGWLE